MSHTLGLGHSNELFFPPHTVLLAAWGGVMRAVSVMLAAGASVSYLVSRSGATVGSNFVWTGPGAEDNWAGKRACGFAAPRRSA